MRKIKVEIKWAILFIVASLLWALGERLVGLHDKNIQYHSIVSNFFAIVAFAIYALALIDKRKSDFGGKITWIQGFISGLIMTLIITLLTPLSQYFIITVITPHYFENMISYTVEQGHMALEVVENNFNMKSYIIESTMFAPIAGLATAAIVAIFVRKQ